jgi:hypothetical protein
MADLARTIGTWTLTGYARYQIERAAVVTIWPRRLSGVCAATQLTCAPQVVTASVLTALRAGERPTGVAAKSPLTETYVRKLARENGIPEYLLRRYPKARAELEARLPRWRETATAIGELGIGLDDAEYVGGVLWYGVTHRGGEGNPEEQKRHHRPAGPLGNPGRRGLLPGRGRHPLRPERVPGR